MNCQKSLFSLDPKSHYLNCAYKGPLLKSAEQAAIDALIRDRNPAKITTEDFFSETEQVKSHFANLIHADPKQIITIPSVSYGFSNVLANINPKKNGKALIFENAFPSGYFALKKWSEIHDNKLIIIKEKHDSLDWNQAILNAIDDDTSILVMAHTHWVNGYVFDLEAIGKACVKHDVKLIVDGTQSVGMKAMDINTYHIDALICAGYKWLLGPYSLGLAYISSEFDNGQALEESWMNRINAKQFGSLSTYEAQYMPGAARYNVGEASNMILMPMLKKGLEQLIEWQPQKMEAYVEELVKPLVGYVEQSNFQMQENCAHHLKAIYLPSQIDMTQLIADLKSNSIFVSVRESAIRLSFNVFNDANNISALIEVLDQQQVKS